jgi:RNA polymerase sigma-32 factor
MRQNHAGTGDSDNLPRYLFAVYSYSMLSADVEQALCLRWRDKHDTSAAHQLVGSHLRLVVKFAGAYRGYGLPMEDLMGEGHVGLMRAVCRFDPDRGVRFATYALWWIRSEIQGYVLRNWSLMRPGATSVHKKLFFNLRKTRPYLRITSDGELNSEDVSRIDHILEVPEDDVIRMDQRLFSRDISLNVPMNESDPNDWQTQLVDEQGSQETILSTTENAARQHALLRSAFGGLTPREQRIIAARHMGEAPLTLSDLSEQHGISRERVRQIEVRAIEKLKRSVRGSVSRVRGESNMAVTVGQANAA